MIVILGKVLNTYVLPRKTFTHVTQVMYELKIFCIRYALQVEQTPCSQCCNKECLLLNTTLVVSSFIQTGVCLELVWSLDSFLSYSRSLSQWEDIFVHKMSVV